MQSARTEILRHASLAWLLALLAAVQMAWGDEPSPVEAQTPSERFETLVTEARRNGNSKEFAGRFVELAKQHPRNPVALDALYWVIRHGSVDNGMIAADELIANHIHSERLPALAQLPSPASERVIRGVLQKHPKPAMQARACLELAEWLKQQRQLSIKARDDAKISRGIEQRFGKTYRDHLVTLDLNKSETEMIGLLERVVMQYGDVMASSSVELTTLAQQALFEIRHGIGKPAPEIEGEDIDGMRFKLSDYRGKIVVLDFWVTW